MLVLITGAVLSIRSGRKLITNERRVAHSLEILDHVTAVLGAMTEAETGQRGYVITGEDVYLEPYETAKRRIGVLVSEVDSMTRGDSIQSGRASVLRNRVALKLTELEMVVQARQGAGFGPARALVLTNIGRTEMDDIRRVAALMAATENRRLRERSAESARASRTTITLMVAGGAIELAALLLFYGVAVRGLAERRRADLERTRLLERERDAREAAESASRAKDDFLAIASHELRTPITALRLQVQIVERTLAQAIASAKSAGEQWEQEELERVLGMVKVLSDDSKRIGGLIGGLLDVTRIATGQFDLHPENSDLRDIVRSAVAGLHGTGETRRISLDLPAPLPGWWDRLRLEQVVTNLLSNAIRYGAGSAIAVRARSEDHAAILEVEDRGPGIPTALLPRMFDRFTRGEDHEQGLGLGLYITRRIVEAHGGTIEAAGVPGGGARFTVRLPRS